MSSGHQNVPIRTFWTQCTQRTSKPHIGSQINLHVFQNVLDIRMQFLETWTQGLPPIELPIGTTSCRVKITCSQVKRWLQECSTCYGEAQKHLLKRFRCISIQSYQPLPFLITAVWSSCLLCCIVIILM